jgi:prevent-host-death family protein
MKTVSASDFKARCLAILDDVARSGERVTITKRGKAVAQLIPPLGADARDPLDALRGTAEITGDLVAPAAVWRAARRDGDPLS